MTTIGIGEIQKNSSIFSNLSEAIQIVDKRKKRALAMVYPIRDVSIVEDLAGKYRDKIQATVLSDAKIKELAMKEAMSEKYDLSS